MSEGEANEFSYLLINYEYDIQVDKSSWLPKKWDIKIFGITKILLVVKWMRLPRNECEEKRTDYYRNIPIFKEGDS